MVDIQPAAAEIRRGKKKKEEEDRRKETTGQKYNGPPITQGGHNYHEFKESGPNDCDNDQQPKVHAAIWPPKPKYLYLWNYGR